MNSLMTRMLVLFGLLICGVVGTVLLFYYGNVLAYPCLGVTILVSFYCGVVGERVAKIHAVNKMVNDLKAISDMLRDEAMKEIKEINPYGEDNDSKEKEEKD